MCWLPVFKLSRVCCGRTRDEETEANNQTKKKSERKVAMMSLCNFVGWIAFRRLFGSCNLSVSHIYLVAHDGCRSEGDVFRCACRCIACNSRKCAVALGRYFLEITESGAGLWTSRFSDVSSASGWYDIVLLSNPFQNILLFTDWIFDLSWILKVLLRIMRLRFSSTTNSNPSALLQRFNQYPCC